MPDRRPSSAQSRPPWARLVGSQSGWEWRSGRLCHEGAPVTPPADAGLLQRLFVRFVYADQNRATAVQRALARCLDRLGPDDWGINLGSGTTHLHPQVVNVDVVAKPGVQVVTSGVELPFGDASLALVISQEVLEHVEHPREWLNEVRRVLRPGGWFYCQVPFIIGYHPGPTDFRRYTCQGVEQLFAEPEWRLLELDTSVGHGTGFYRVAVEFLAVSASGLGLYKPVKALAAASLLPLKLADLLPVASPQRHRIPGGYFAIGERT